MTIEEKWNKIKEHCSSKRNCYDCELYKVEPSCWHVFIFGSDEEVEELYNILTFGTEAFTRNVAEVSDEFICEQCGIHIEDFVRTVYDEESEDTTYKGYEFKFCPECGKKVVEE